MKAVIIQEAGRIEIAEIPIPEPGPGEVLIQVTSVGICGTDLHILDGHYAPSLPITPGHEFAGVVAGLGEGVQGLAVSDRVTADPNIYCGKCALCRAGRTNLCANAAAIGVNLPGAMAQYVVAPAANCVVLGNAVDLAASSLVEPLSCAVHAFDVLNARLGQDVLVYGAGPMGLILASLARRALSASVSVVDLNEERLEWARRAGATHVSRTASDLPFSGADVVIDCTGATPAIEDGISRLAAGGTFLQFGVPRADAKISMSPERLLMSELTLTGSRAVHQSFERAARLFEMGAIDPALLISDRFSLDEAAEAFARFRSSEGRKIQILPV
ncbi:zinc-dependent alcohol dehydrogenase family protein [Microbacterium keratanolyticum]